MSAPRHRPPHRRSLTGAPYGLAATMLRVTVAELTDSGRLMRGRRLQDERAVLWIRVEPGRLVGEVMGSAPQPYQVEWASRPMAADAEAKRRELARDNPSRVTALVPPARGLRPFCECPDDAAACKHAVAVLLELADDVAYDGELLAEWRNVPLLATDPVDPADPALDHTPPPPAREERTSAAEGSGMRGGRDPVPFVDPLGDLLAFPAGAHLLAGRPRIEPLDPPVPRGEDDLLRRCLAEALDWLQQASPY